MKTCFVVVSGVLAALSGTFADAQTVAYSNFVTSGPSAPYDPSGDSLTLTGSPRWGIGYRFTSLASGDVAWIDTGLFAGGADASGSEVQWEIRTEATDRTIGELLAVFEEPLTFPFGAPARITPESTISLVAGESYWITASGDTSPDSSPVWYWGDADPAFQNSFALLLGGTEWLSIDVPVPQGAYEIVLVPAPAAGAVLTLAGFFCAGRRRR